MLCYAVRIVTVVEKTYYQALTALFAWWNESVSNIVYCTWYRSVHADVCIVFSQSITKLLTVKVGLG